MIKVRGTFAEALVYTSNPSIEETAYEQIENMCNNAYSEGCQICIMPDVHAGNGCTIGTVIKFKDKVNPSLVGCDIGCGILSVKLSVKASDINLSVLDKFINETQPLQTHYNEYLKDGAIKASVVDKFVDETKSLPTYYNAYLKESIRKEIHPDYATFKIDKLLSNLKCIKAVNLSRVAQVFGTIGGGNHFIELNTDSEGYVWLSVHTGSRTLGKYIEKYYTRLAYENCTSLSQSSKEELASIKRGVVEHFKLTGRKELISEELKRLQKSFKELNVMDCKKSDAYLTGEDLQAYLNDMYIAQSYANYNRLAIAYDIIKTLGSNCSILSTVDTVHNYIDIHNNVLHKGSIRANEGDLVIIPMNMRDGSLLCVGKGNQSWLNSAPHGAGRLMSRGTAFSNLTMDEYVKSMENIATSSVCEETIDEAPMCYKPKEYILENIKETVDMIDTLVPIYNYKNR